MATSWAPCTLEDGFRLDAVFAKTGQFPVVKAKAFFPAEQGVRLVNNSFMRAVPLAPGEGVGQDKMLDESPIGLRGLWGNAKDSGGGQMARWSRQGSGVIGPVPAPGGRLQFQLECAFMEITPEWTKQIVRILPPWGGAPVPVEVEAGWQTVAVPLVRPAEDEQRSETGAYSLSVEKPYNPNADGLRGYPDDLGVQIRRIIIRIEPAGHSMPD